MSTIINVSDLSKSYHIGEFSSESFFKELKSRLYKNITNSNEFENKSISKNSNSLVWSLKDVSFKVDDGEVLGIIGKNGAGKSTLLKLLSQITSPTSGEIKIKGKIASLLEVGTGFHPDLSGRDNIFLNGAILGMRTQEIKKKFDEIVAFSGVEKYIDTPVKRYSSGMYVRLAFSVAAHLNTQILIVDEVLAVGDADFQKKCLGKMDDVSKEDGKTILFVSHNIQAVRQLCSRCIMLEKGRLIHNGSTNETIGQYLNLNTTRGYETKKLGSTIANGSLNFLSIRVKNNYGETINTYEISKNYIFEIKYEVLIESKVKFSLIICTQEGIEVFASINNHEPNYYGEMQSPGIYSSEIEIPGNFFNAGFYTVSLSTFMDYVINSSLENILTFETLDDGVLKKDFFGTYGGVIRPLLKWTTYKKEN
jgi:lipopolysaccharide transport system ATP-binding protein